MSEVQLDPNDVIVQLRGMLSDAQWSLALSRTRVESLQDQLDTLTKEDD